MTTQQRLATGFLALLIVGSVALMPSDADSKAHAAAPKRAATPPPVPEEPVRDLTYN